MAPPRAELWGVVLAAGESRRFLEAAAHDSDRSYPRTLKQLQIFDGEPLVRRVAQAAIAAGLHGVTVVAGCRAAEVRQAVEGLELRFVENLDFAEGRSSSIRAAVESLPRSAQGAMFLPSDQPLLDVETLTRLRAAFENDPSAIVVPVHRDRSGAPVSFPRELFDQLTRLEGDSGGRDLFDRNQKRLVHVELASELPLRDIDTPASLRRLRGQVDADSAD